MLDMVCKLYLPVSVPRKNGDQTEKGMGWVRVRERGNRQDLPAA
jgi:hypothetical protein